MFKNRELVVTMNKKDKDAMDTSDPKSFEEKAEYVLLRIEGFTTKMFIGMCIYIWLDTRRQVKIEQAKYQYK